MKAIINGRRYDTAKAIKIGSASGGGGRSDFRHFYEVLYRTPVSGRFFLAGEGGPLTRWARSTGQNSWCGGVGIMEMDREEALAWAEANLDAASIEEHFADSIEAELQQGEIS